MLTMAKMIIETLENHNLLGGTYLTSLYLGVHPPGGGRDWKRFPILQKQRRYSKQLDVTMVASQLTKIMRCNKDGAYKKLIVVIEVDNHFLKRNPHKEPVIFRERVKWFLDVGSSSDESRCEVEHRFLVKDENNCPRNKWYLLFSSIIFTLRIVNFQCPLRHSRLYQCFLCLISFFSNRKLLHLSG